MTPMRTVFMGTPDFAAAILAAMAERRDLTDLVAVVTQPDRPRGRGKKLSPSPVKAWALSHDIPVLQPVRARDAAFAEELRALRPDVAVVAAFGQILTQEILDIPVHGCINVHASLLPLYRGAAPIQHAVMDGAAVTGITTMQMDAGLDTGDMLLRSVHSRSKSQMSTSSVSRVPESPSPARSHRLLRRAALPADLP